MAVPRREQNTMQQNCLLFIGQICHVATLFLKENEGSKNRIITCLQKSHECQITSRILNGDGCLYNFAILLFGVPSHNKHDTNSYLNQTCKQDTSLPCIAEQSTAESDAIRLTNKQLGNVMCSTSTRHTTGKKKGNMQYAPRLRTRNH